MTGRSTALRALCTAMTSVALLAGCSHPANPQASGTATATSPTGSLGKPPFPTLTAPALQPPKQNNENRPDVAFDPCTWIDDDTLTKLGYDPTTRQRSRVADIHAEYTFLSCEANSADKVFSLSVLSGNRTLEEGRAKANVDGDPLQDTTIGGRAAIVELPHDGFECDIMLQTKVGYVLFMRNIEVEHVTSGPTPERCSGMTDLVAAIIPRIGDN